MKYVSIPSYVWYKFAHNQKPGGRPSQGGRKTVSLIQSLKSSNYRMLLVVRWFPFISEIQENTVMSQTSDLVYCEYIRLLQHQFENNLVNIRLALLALLALALLLNVDHINKPEDSCMKYYKSSYHFTNL